MTSLKAFMKRLQPFLLWASTRQMSFTAPTSCISPLEIAKKQAAYAAVDKYFPSNARAVGIGSGSTIIYAVDRIKESGLGKGVVFVPTGYQSKLLLERAELTVAPIDRFDLLDITFDGADEVDGNLDIIKGGGACLFQEKLIAVCSKKLVIVADSRKRSDILGTNWESGVPIEVVPTAYTYVLKQLLKLGCREPQLRMGGKAKAGPVITDNCNFIIDAPWGKINVPRLLEKQIKEIVGVVEVGLFIGLAHVVVFAGNDGIHELVRKKN
ncbi:Ribose-5-phosphate isomerase [Neolecta irregularis DAH-3]|uniref:Ribose-5-phosphate isomerase n=1 Tax=Neolecta irregularis (strain DAH-3) TaxID=1198029 RepID=A0A1U7LS44_NEOID|nr:Ribose-5-phosphate isomerase [Neolecta irregularis DAH-3]|eukprot:OLL25403.1 Ribose-5-phosphate isomerase [Neolecta irregularis DAH-3]